MIETSKRLEGIGAGRKKGGRNHLQGQLQYGSKPGYQQQRVCTGSERYFPGGDDRTAGKGPVRKF